MFSAVQQVFPIGPRFFAGIGCLFVIVWISSVTPSADASCGDYLHGFSISHRHDDRQTLNSSGGWSTASLPSTSEFDDESTPVRPRCSGPSCQQTPPVPQESPQSDYSRTSFKELYIESRCVNDAIESWFRLGLLSDALAEMPVLSRLDRPPQVA